MVNRYIAHTEPINPKGASPVLTRAQVWAGLQRKVRSPVEFVQVILSAKVLSEEGNIVKREAIFKEGFGHFKNPVVEVCKECEPTLVNFVGPDGSTIQNIVSDGPGGGDQNLQLTYLFEILLPDVKAGSKEDIDVRKQYENESKIAVTHTIDVIRRLVVSGKL